MAGAQGLRQWLQGWRREAHVREIDPAEAGAEFGLELRFVAVTSPSRLSTGLPEARPAATSEAAELLRG